MTSRKDSSVKDVVLKWSTPKSTSLELQRCTSAYRVTPSDVSYTVCIAPLCCSVYVLNISVRKIEFGILPWIFAAFSTVVIYQPVALVFVIVIFTTVKFSYIKRKSLGILLLKTMHCIVNNVPVIVA